MKRRINKKKKVVYLLLIVLLTLTVGYAVVMTNLKLIGYTTVKRKAWGIYWNNVQLTEGSSPTSEPVIGKIGNDQEKTNITFTATLNGIDDFYEFTVDAVNEGDVDAMITSVAKTSSPTLPVYIKYIVTYEDGVEVDNNHILKAAKNSETPTIETYKVRVDYDKDSITNEMINNMPENQTYTLSFEVTYEKATSSAIEREYHITSCPGCAFKYANSTYNFNNYQNQQISTFTDYVTDYKQLKVSYYIDDNGNTCDPENSTDCKTRTYQRNVFMGSQLDSNNKIKKAYICGIHKDKPFCLEEDIIAKTTGNKAYEKNLKVLKQIYNFNSDCSESESGNYYLLCGNRSNNGEVKVSIEDTYSDQRYMEISTYTGGDFKCIINYEGHMYCSENSY